MAQRPMTQREMRTQREKHQEKEEYVIVYNNSKQLINLQIVRRPKAGQKKLDFYFAQQTMALQPKATVKLSKSEVMQDQLHNLQAKGYIKILSNSAE